MSAKTAFEQREVRLPQGTVRYLQGGAGAPLLYLHGAGGARISPALERLMAARTIYLPIAPGFDGTEAIQGINDCSDLANLYGAFAKKVIGGECDLLGHSFGGRLAVSFAASFPELVRLLVLEAPSGFRAPGSPEPRRDRSAIFAHPERLSDDKAFASLDANRKIAVSYHKAIDMDGRLVAQLESIKALTLILRGTKDGMVSEDSAIFVKSRIPASYLIYVYDAAHAIEVDQPERFATLTGDFLTRGSGFLVNPGSGPGDGASARMD